MNTFKVRRLAAAVVVFGLALAGCGGGSKTSSTPAEHVARAPQKSSNGIPLPSAPHRIVSLSGSATEDLFAVGAGPQVVAADEFSTYPANAPRTKLNGFSPNVEAIAKYRPDLVVVALDVNHVSSHLAALHIPVLVEPAPADLSGAYAELSALGKATGHARQASQVVSTMRARVATIVGSVPKAAHPLSVYHELDASGDSASSATFIGALYKLLGLHNIADKAAAKGGPYPKLSPEYIIGSNPDVIVLADTVCCGQSLRSVSTRPGWRNIAAVKDGMVVPVNDTVASQWGPRIVLLLSQVAGAVKHLEAGK